MTELAQHRALSDLGARQLANATKSAPKLDTISPRSLTHLLQWLRFGAAIYRLVLPEPGEACRLGPGRLVELPVDLSSGLQARDAGRG